MPLANPRPTPFRGHPTSRVGMTVIRIVPAFQRLGLRRDRFGGRGSRVALRHQRAHDPFMHVVVTSNNAIRLSFLTALLADAGIETVLLDSHTSILEGSAGAIPRRLMVGSDDFDRACQILREAGEW